MVKIYTFDENPFYSTKKHNLVLKQVNRVGISIRLSKDKINVIYPLELRSNSKKVKEAIRLGINKALLKEATKYLPGRVKLLSRMYQTKYLNFGLYNHCDHWGSLTSCNEIVLNIQLMRLPDHLIDYVILHEFAHIKHHDHTPEFWKYLSSMSKDPLKLHKELVGYNHYIEKFGLNDLIIL